MARSTKKNKASKNAVELNQQVAEIEAIRVERARSLNLIRTLVRLYRLCYSVPSTI